MQYGKKDRREFDFTSHVSALRLALSSVNLWKCVVVAHLGLTLTPTVHWLL